MTRTLRHVTLAISLTLLATADLGALPLPKAPDAAPLPEGAIRRFGAPAPKKAAAEVPAPRPAQLMRRSRSDQPLAPAIALTVDGKQLVVADYTGRVELWEVATGRLVKRLQEPGPDPVHSLAVSPDGRWLACGRTRPDVQVWDLAAGKVVRTIPLNKPDDGDRGLPERMAFTPDGKTLFTGVETYSSSADRGMTAWEVASGRKLWNVTGVGYNLAADPRGRWVLSSLLQEEQVKLALLDAATGKVVGSMPVESSWEADEGVVRPVDPSATLDRLVTPGGSRLISLHDDGTARAWDAATGRELSQFKWGRVGQGLPGGLASSPDGRWATARQDARVVVWELTTGRLVHTLAGEAGPAREMAFTRDGRGLITSAGPAPILWALRPKDLPPIDGPADALWEALGSDDAAAAYRLQWALVGNPKAAVGLFAPRVRPAELVLARDRFDRLVAALDHARFAVRDRAEGELAAAGIKVPVAWLRDALAKAESEEMQARLRRVLARRDSPGPARWRLERAVQVLELAGTPDAVALLKEWAAGSDGAGVSEDAAAALRRLGVKP